MEYGIAIDGLRVHDNTFLWDPPIDSPVFNNEAVFSGTGSNSFEDNLIVSSVPWMVRSDTAVGLNGNRYVYAGAGSWVWNGAALTGFADYQKTSGQDSRGAFSSVGPESLEIPRPEPVSPDFLTTGFDVRGLRGSYALVSFVALTSGERDKADPSRSQAVVLQSAAFQYEAKNLKVVAVAAPASRNPGEAAADWNLDGVQVLSGTSGTVALPTTFLLDREGRVLKRWASYAPAKEIIFAVRKLLGPPLGVSQ